MKVKKVWTLTMKTGTYSSFSQKLYSEPDEHTILDFIHEAKTSSGWITNKIEVNTSWEIEF